MSLTEAELNTRLANVNDAINTLLTTGSITDNEAGELKITKSATLRELRMMADSTQDQINRIPAVAVHSEMDLVNRFGVRDVDLRGSVAQ